MRKFFYEAIFVGSVIEGKILEVQNESFANAKRVDGIVVDVNRNMIS